MTELKPCPFCGGTDFTECLDGGIWPDYMYNKGGVPPSNEYVIRDEIMCNTCGTSVQSCSHGERLADVTPEEAEQNTYRLWNTRAERTCTVEGVYDYYESSDLWAVLSCGHEFEWNDEEPPAYCPKCGAKVVDE